MILYVLRMESVFSAQLHPQPSSSQLVMKTIVVKYQEKGSEFRQCIELLVEAGANVTTSSPMALSALGMYWSRRKEKLQFRKTMLGFVYEQRGTRHTGNGR